MILAVERQLQLQEQASDGRQAKQPVLLAKQHQHTLLFYWIAML
jgi:hypothetical protein